MSENPINILMVDDREENLLALEQLLEGPEYNLIKATSGPEALARLLEYDFALVLLDVQMPEMDGFEVAELMRLKARTKQVPIIFVTAINKDQRYVFKGYQAGAVDYLFKPIDPVILESKVRIFASLYRQRKQLEKEIERRETAEWELRREQNLFHQGPVVVFKWLAIENWPVEYVSPNISQFGYRAEELVSGEKTWLEIIHSDDRDRVISETGVLSESNRNFFEQDYRILQADGREKWVYVFTLVVRSDLGQITHYDGYILDITERKRTEKALEESEERYRTVTEFASDFVYWRTADGWMRYVSPSCLDITGYDPEAFYSNPHLIDELVHIEDRDLWGACIRDAETGVCHSPVEFRIMTKDREVRWVSHTSRPLRGEDGRLLGIRAGDHDITRLKTVEEQLRRLNSIDGLTQVANRRYFDDELDKEWRRSVRRRTFISMIMIDIDFFKAYNDTYGHQQGDEALRRVAAELAKTAKRPRELVARYGGEEFAAILLETDLESSAKLAEKIRANVEALRIEHTASQPLPVLTISLGVAAMLPKLGDESASLISRADKALYLAKERGRNQVVTLPGA